jgi:hypothetical protein
MDRAFAAIRSPPAGLAGMRELYRARATVDRDAGAALVLARRAFGSSSARSNPIAICCRRC